MKYLVIFALILSACTKSEKTLTEKDVKFHYGEHVEIVGGFYKGCSGTIQSYKLTTEGIGYEIHDITCPTDFPKDHYLDGVPQEVLR